MAETAAAKAAKTAQTPAPAADGAAAPSAKPTLREIQPKKFAPSSLQALGHDFEMLAVRAPANWTFEDILKPIAWANVASIVAKDALNTRRDKIGSLIYVRHDGGAFKAILSIEAITHDQFGSANGLVVEPWLVDKKATKE